MFTNTHANTHVRFFYEIARILQNTILCVFACTYTRLCLFLVTHCIQIFVCVILQLIDLAVSDYQPLINDLVMASRELNQLCGNSQVGGIGDELGGQSPLGGGISGAHLSVRDVVDKFASVQRSIYQQREAVDLLPCVSRQDVSYQLVHFS